jgi:hypothetical protein
LQKNQPKNIVNIYKMENAKQKFISMKKDKRGVKRADKRSTTAEEVIFIFEKVLEGWKTIRIFNTIIQQNPASTTNKKKVEQIATGNCKLFESELPADRYAYYVELRNKMTSIQTVI